MFFARRKNNMREVIVVTSGKGGVGKRRLPLISGWSCA